MEEPRGRRIRESAGDAIVDAHRRAAHTGTPTGTPSGARAAGDVGPYHAHMVPARSTHPMVGRDVPGAPRTRGRHRERPQPRGPPRTSAPTTASHGVGPKHAPHGRARRPRRAAYMETPTGTPSGARAAEDVGPYHIPMVSDPAAHPMVGRDVLGAPRTWKRPRGRHQARGPPRTSAPPTRTWCRPVPRTHPSAYAVRVLRAPAHRPQVAVILKTPAGGAKEVKRPALRTRNLI